MRVDLFLGGPQGEWAWDQVPSRDMGCVFSGPDVGDPGAEVGLSVHFPHLLPPAVIGRYRAIYNIHPGYLPWGRSYYPVFWALWADEPAGCTLHVIDEGIDTGPIVDQRRVDKYDWDTGGTLHRRVMQAERQLFLDYWPRIAAGENLSTRPQQGRGSIHYKRDFFARKRRVNMDGLELLRLIRCLSHPDYTGLEVKLGGRLYEISARQI